MRRVAVIGLGRFGMSVARHLAQLGTQVIAVDRSMPLINEIKDEVDLAVRLDSTDPDALQAQDINKVDVCVVAIGENFEASLLTTVILQKMGVPRIICRAQTSFHAQIFHQIGATEVIQPESSAGEQLSRRLAHPHLREVIDLTEEFSLVEVKAPESWCGRAINEIGLRANFHVNLVIIKRTEPADGDEPAREIVSVPRPETVLEPDDLLLLVGSNDAVEDLPVD